MDKKSKINEPAVAKALPQKVKIVDDTLRRNVSTPITPQIREQAARAGNPIPKTTLFLLSKDDFGRQVQEEVHSVHEYVGDHLRNTVNRAKRYMRSKRFLGGRAPRHLAMAMAVFQKADPAGFDKALANAQA